ncbi:hypothetical protein [Shewanella sp. YLB-07]|nr:hypothetical protein [Shewanella sp. YLB-07]
MSDIQIKSAVEAELMRQSGKLLARVFNTIPSKYLIIQREFKAL